ncbi:MAG: FG-GAP-like repeat-containing protein, partial [Proteobacteria bacterium]|nr:FG-GAP-like repeat-containing protein [Pseudomonadota bacterium]
MTTSVPILIPPGRTLVTPDLKLAYSSSGSDGPFGKGWDLALGSIQRNTKNGVPQCVGDHRTNAFVVNMPGASSELRFIEDEPAGTALYRARLDGAFLEARLDTAANTWEVIDSRGVRFRLGSTPNTRVARGNAAVLMDTVACEFTTLWALDQIEDPHRNHVDVTYEKHANTLYPASVSYGGNLGTNLEHPFRVTMVTSDTTRVMPQESYLLGALQRLEKAITEIHVEAKAAEGGAFANVRTYTLEYERREVQGDTLLSVVRVPGLPDQGFSYSETSVNSTRSVSQPAPTVSVQNAIRRSANNGRRMTRSVMDMNGDGYLDVVDTTEVTDAWNVYYGGPEGFSTTPRIWTLEEGQFGIPIKDRLTQTTQDGGTRRTIREAIDLDGDGIVDFLDSQRNGVWHLYRGRCTSRYVCGFEGVPTPWAAFNIDFRTYHRTEVTESGQAVRTRVRRGPLDVNGDGRPDLVIAPAGGSWQVFRNTGSGFEDTPMEFDADGPISQIYTTFSERLSELEHFDWNGDNLPDRWFGMNVALNNGHGFDEYVQIGSGVIRTARTDNDGWATYADIVDLNGDGRPDRMVANASITSPWYVNLMPPFGLLNRVTWGNPSPRGWMRYSNASNSTQNDLLDWNGDGHLDTVNARAGGGLWGAHLHGIEAPYNQGNPFYAIPPGLLTRIDNGFGGIMEVVYRPSNHFDNSGPSDDVQRLPMRTWVVSAIRKTDGLCTDDPGPNPFDRTTNPCIDQGHEIVQTIEYEGGYFDAEDREFRGFRKVMVETLDQGVRVVTFDQSDDLAGSKLSDEIFAVAT